MDHDDLRRWVSEYERLWRADAVSELASLFARHATYRGDPFDEPALGLKAIAAMWPEEAGAAFTVSSEVVAVDGDVGVVRLDVRYTAPREERYLDLWIVRLDGDGRCVAFEEWALSPPGDRGGVLRKASI